MSSDLARIPKVSTLAKPSGQLLVAARFEVQRNETVRAVFEKYKGQTGENVAKELADELREPLGQALTGELREPLGQALTGDVTEVCQYLADEYLQIGDAVLIVDRNTGLPLMRVTDEDMWQPPDVPRDSGGMATPLMQLKPELLGFLMRWTFESARERNLVTDLAKRVAQTELLAEEGDRRLLPTTREGRRVIVQDLEDALPHLLPENTTGQLKQFFEGFVFQAPEQTSTYKPYLGFKAYARVSMPLMDHKARNLLFDVLSSHRAVITAQWGREIARTFTTLAHAHMPPREVSFPTYARQPGTVATSATPMMWVAPPEQRQAIREKLHAFVVPVEGALTTAIPWWPVRVGHIVLKEPNIAHREVHDRWEIAATIDYDLHIDWSTVRAFQFSDVPQPEIVAEFVR